MIGRGERRALEEASWPGAGDGELRSSRERRAGYCTDGSEGAEARADRERRLLPSNVDLAQPSLSPRTRPLRSLVESASYSHLLGTDEQPSLADERVPVRLRRGQGAGRPVLGRRRQGQAAAAPAAGQGRQQERGRSARRRHRTRHPVDDREASEARPTCVQDGFDGWRDPPSRPLLSLALLTAEPCAASSHSCAPSSRHALRQSQNARHFLMTGRLRSLCVCSQPA